MATVNDLVQASAFFRKRKRRGEDELERIILGKESKMHAAELGLDGSERQTFAWFIDQITAMELPQPYERVYDQAADTLTYLNLRSGERLEQHPNLGLFRRLLYQFFENQSGASTFDSKVKRLLPFIADKLARDNVGLNSKRREFEKVNMKKEGSSKVIPSKLERLPPDTDKLLQTRNYLLKTLIDKVVSREELYGDTRRARAFAGVLARHSKEGFLQAELEPAEQSMAQLERIFIEARDYYVLEYGKALDRIPESVEESLLFRKLTPALVLDAVQALGIGRDEPHLYWLAKLYCALPLPPHWNRIEGQDEPEFLYKPTNTSFGVHPAILYLAGLLNYQKQKLYKLSPGQRQALSQRSMQFFDSLDRAYEVDLFYLLNPNPLADSSLLFNDWVLLSTLHLAQPQPADYFLLEHVIDFYKQLDSRQLGWHPEVGITGDVRWSSTVTQSMVQQNPFAAAVTARLDGCRLAVPEDVTKPYYQQLLTTPGGKAVDTAIRADRKLSISASVSSSSQQIVLSSLRQLLDSLDALSQSEVEDSVYFNQLDLDSHIDKEFQGREEESPVYFKAMRIKGVISVGRLLGLKLRNSPPLLKDLGLCVAKLLPFVQAPDIRSLQDFLGFLKHVQEAEVPRFIPVVPEDQGQAQPQQEEEQPRDVSEDVVQTTEQQELQEEEQPDEFSQSVQQSEPTTEQEPDPLQSLSEDKIDQALAAIHKSAVKAEKYVLKSSRSTFSNLQYIQDKEQRLKQKKNFIRENIARFPQVYHGLVEGQPPKPRYMAAFTKPAEEPLPFREKQAEVHSVVEDRAVERGRQFISAIEDSQVEGSLLLPRANLVLPGLLPQFNLLKPLLKLPDNISPIQPASEDARVISENDNEGSTTSHATERSLLRTMDRFRSPAECDQKDLSQMFTKRSSAGSTRISEPEQGEWARGLKVIRHKRQLFVTANTAQYWTVRKVVETLSAGSLTPTQQQRLVEAWLHSGQNVQSINRTRLQTKISPFWIESYKRLMEEGEERKARPDKAQSVRVKSLSKQQSNLPRTDPSSKVRCMSSSRMQTAFLRPQWQEQLTLGSGFGKVSLQRFKQTLLRFH